MNEQDRQQRLYVARMAEKLRAGKISRREFIRAAALAGFGFSSAWYLGGCAPARPAAPAQPAATEAPKVDATTGSGSLTPQQQFLKEVGGKFKGTRIKIVSENTSPGLVISKLMKEEFTPLTGIEVDWEIVPLDQVLAKTIQDTVVGATGGKGQSDIYYWDQAWLGRFVNDSIPVDELLAKTDLAYPDYKFDDFLPQLVRDIASYKGTKIGVPFDIPIFIMMYRKDIFDELKLSVPTTMQEYMDVVKAIHEAKSGQGIMGTVGQWKSGHYALQCDATAWMWSHGGAHFDADGKPMYTAEENIEGMRYMMELGKYMDPGVTGWDWGGQGDAFTQGKAGIFISWGEFFPGFDDPSRSKVVGLVEPADCPKEAKLRPREQCGYDETPGISHQGGSCLAISKYAPNPDAAWVFLQWATSADLTARANAQGANVPIRASNYTDPRVLENNKVVPGTTRHFEVTRRAIETRMGTEPHLPQWAALANDVNAVEYGKMTTKQQSIEDTLKAIQEKTEKVMQAMRENGVVA
jgi:multiple sugar transport system substrate-binding protein